MSVVTTEIQSSIAIITVDNPPVNATSVNVRQGLLEALEQTESNSSVSAVVLHCAGRSFIAGGDIREFDQAPLEPHLPDVILAIESAAKPWIVAMHGNALGGGLEIALGCSYRIAAADTKLGLPEVLLGLIPGAGGTVRLPKLVGTLPALDMISTGKPVTADKALSLGLIDRVSTGDLLHDAIRIATTFGDKPGPILMRELDTASSAEDFEDKKQKIQSRARGQTAPLSVVEAFDNTLSMEPAKALDAERALFLSLKDNPQSSAMRHIFFAERSAGRLPELKGVQAYPCSFIGIIGGGTMGSGITAACLLAGFQVTLIETNDDALQAGVARVADILDKSLQRGLINQEKRENFQAALRASIDYKALSDADLVVEAVYESMEVKQQVFKQLDAVVGPHCVLASNTSYLNVNDIAAASKAPERVIGLHFFSPAHIMKLLEVIVTEQATPETLATGFALGKRLRKICVPAGVCDGFIGNRIMSGYRRECEYMIEDGALPEEVDKAMRDYGFAMGLFEVQDMAGLDISWAMRKRQAATRNPNQRYVSIPDLLCESGRLGRKSGKGWYRYDSGKAETDQQVTDIILAESARNGITRKPHTADEIMDRILTSMRTTAKELLEEGIAHSAEDIDVVMVNGYGFPRYRGGPMHRFL